MKNRLKFLALSFFSDKTAKQAPSYGYGMTFLTVALAIVFLVLGFIGALFVPFRTLYKNSPEFKAAAEEVFCGENAPVLTVSNARLSAAFSEQNKEVFDSVANADDKSLVTHGCDVIIDTRPSGLYDDFTAYCVSESGEEIAYEKYLELSESARKNYKFEVRYSGRELVIDEEKIVFFEKYLSETENTEIAAAYKKLPAKSDEKYASELYELYVKAYYPDLSAYETGGAAPKLRNFYFHNYATKESILFVFDDALIGRFASKSGAKTTFYGFYGDMDDGVVAATPKGIEDFFVASFSASKQLMLFANITSMFTLVSYTVVTVILLSAIQFCVRKLSKVDEVTFGGAAKTVGAYSLFGGLIGGLIGFALGFVVSARYFTTVLCMAYFGVVLLRIAVGAIVDTVKKTRAKKQISAENESAETTRGDEQ